MRVWQGVPDGKKWKFLAEAQEVEEINWVAPNPSPDHPNVIALGANDGSVWVYQISTEKNNELQVLQAYYLHTETCTAGTWSPDGSLLATISEDSRCIRRCCLPGSHSDYRLASRGWSDRPGRAFPC